MYDYGTTGFCCLSNCMILLDEFNKQKRKGIRACFYGLAPIDSHKRLFSLKSTEFIIKSCFNKVYDVEFINYHDDGEFYEIIARDSDGRSLNEQLILNKHARFLNPIHPMSFSIFYPSFDLLERSPLYQNYTHRLIFEEFGIDFNAFEEIYIDPERSYEEQWIEYMNDYRFKHIRDVYNQLSA
jgi:hypothetical protein